jgi:hypothetical protein
MFPECGNRSEAGDFIPSYIISIGPILDAGRGGVRTVASTI